MKNNPTKEKIKILTQLAKEKKAQDIVTIDISEVSNITDTLIICSGEGTMHTKTIGKYIVAESKNLDIKMDHEEGVSHGSWILIDFLDVIVHVFEKKTREYYKLEKFWNKMLEQREDNAPKQKNKNKV